MELTFKRAKFCEILTQCDRDMPDLKICISTIFYKHLQKSDFLKMCLNAYIWKTLKKKHKKKQQQILKKNISK